MQWEVWAVGRMRALSRAARTRSGETQLAVISPRVPRERETVCVCFRVSERKKEKRKTPGTHTTQPQTRARVSTIQWDAWTTEIFTKHTYFCSPLWKPVSVGTYWNKSLCLHRQTAAHPPALLHTASPPRPFPARTASGPVRTAAKDWTRTSWPAGETHTERETQTYSHVLPKLNKCNHPLHQRWHKMFPRNSQTTARCCLCAHRTTHSRRWTQAFMYWPTNSANVPNTRHNWCHMSSPLWTQVSSCHYVAPET